MTGYLSLIDRNTIRGKRCRDITPIFSDPAAFAALVDDLACQAPSDVDAVVGVESLGFVLATALAIHLRRGLVPIRKGGKLPVAVHRVAAGEQTLEIRADALGPGCRVLLVDDWIHTGDQVRAAIALVEGQGAHVAGIIAINIDDRPSTRPILDGYAVGTVFRNGEPR